MPAPTDISGLVHRFRVSQLTGYSNGGLVNSAPFETGGITLAQATSGNQPTYVTSSINSVAGLRFNGSSTFMNGSIPSNVNQSYTLSLVLKINDASSLQEIMNTASASVFINGSYAFYAGSSVSGGTVSLGAHVVTIVADSSSTYSTIYVDGTSVASSGGGSGSLSTSYGFGRNDAAGRYFNGDICEYVVYSKSLSASERATLHSYVQNAYAITVSDYTASSTASTSRLVRSLDLTSLVLANSGFQTANAQTANYTLVRGDVGKVIEMNVSSANTITIPANANVAFPVGSLINLYQVNTGATTVTAATGVTLRAPLGATLKSQYAVAQLRQRVVDEWVLSGNLTP